MYRSVLALLFATALLLGGCAAGQQTTLEHPYAHSGVAVGFFCALCATTMEI